MRISLKVLLFILSAFICSTTVSAKDVNLIENVKFNSYFGRENGQGVWFEGTDGVLTSHTQNSWTANIKEIGWGGVWGASVYYKGINIVPANRKFELSFDMISTNCDKVVFVGIQNAETYNYIWGDWITLKKGKIYNYKKSFYLSNTSVKNVDFYCGFGGELGGTMNEENIYRYLSTSTENISSWDQDGYASTTIKCSNLYFGSEIKAPKAAKVKKCTRTKKKIKLSYKQTDAVKYEIKYSTNKKFKKKYTKTITTKKSTYSIKCKKNKKYYIKVRAIKKLYGRTFYGKWSSTKII